MNPNECIRCNAAEPELGRWVCKACGDALDHPEEVKPEPQAARLRLGPSHRINGKAFR
jgi:predicted amidophosphoribosyltransferase